MVEQHYYASYKEVLELRQRVKELERLCRTEFEELNDGDYQSWADVAGRNRIEELEEQLHYTKGCCDLAMKHRDEAEAKLARAHNWVLDNQVHSESYNQFVKALEQDKEDS